MNRSLLLALLSASLLLPPALLPARAAAAQTPSAATAQAQAKLREQLARIEDAAKLEQLGSALSARGEHAAATLAWERLVQLRPHVGDYRLQLAAAYAQQGRKTETYNALVALQAQGYSYDLHEDQRFAKVATTEVWHHILASLDINRRPFGEGELAFTLPAEDLLLESLAWDPKRQQLLVGSARKGAVYRVGDGGRLKLLAAADEANGMWSVMDIAVDAERDLLWVASTAIPHFEGYEPEQDLGRAGVFKFQLSTGRYLDRFLSPVVVGQAFFISSLAVGRKGEVYAADGVNNAVYVVHDDQFRRLFHAPRLSGLRGMSVDGEGDTLYFADSERGIMGFDLASARPFDLRVPPDLALGGIEGLVWWDGALLVVQGHMQPNRVMRLELAEDGRSVTEATPVEANKAALTAPTDAVIGDGRLYLIANSQKANYDRFGLVRDRSQLEGTQIWRVDPGYNREPEPALPPD